MAARYEVEVTTDSGINLDDPKVDLYLAESIFDENNEIADVKGALIGHIRLSTAADYHGFKTAGLAKKLAKAGTGKRIPVASKLYKISLEWSEHNETDALKS